MCGSNASTTGNMLPLWDMMIIISIMIGIINNNQHFVISLSLFLGLTVSLSRDATTGDYALEAGALVLADQGMKNDPCDNDL